MNARVLPLLAVSIATLIYGLTFTIAKDIMPNYVAPFGLIFCRVGGAVIVFWTVGLFVKKPTIERKDYERIFWISFFGVALNMLAYFKGLNLTTPISASVMMVTTPILVLIFSSIILKEKLIKSKIFGIIIGLIGALVLTIYGSTSSADATNPMLGNFLVFINAASYGFYLILARDLIKKYHPIVFIKWFYLIGFVLVFPFGVQEFLVISWVDMPTIIYWEITFIVICTTCLTYLFNLYGLKQLKPTTVSVFVYLQPVIASVYALITGSDSLNFIKIIASLIIFLGVYLVTVQPKTIK